MNCDQYRLWQLPITTSVDWTTILPLPFVGSINTHTHNEFYSFFSELGCINRFLRNHTIYIVRRGLRITSLYLILKVSLSNLFLNVNLNHFFKPMKLRFKNDSIPMIIHFTIGNLSSHSSVVKNDLNYYYLFKRLTN